MKELTKGEIRETALKILQARGCDVWKENNLAVRGRKFIGRKGKADIIGYQMMTGVFVVCEVKTLKDYLSDDQKEFLSGVSKAGGIALLAIQQGERVELIEYKND